MEPQLVASDIDGTFITSAERVTPRLQEAVLRASKSAAIVLATGRPARWVFPVVEQLPIRPLCVCANGAVIYDPAADRILKTRLLSPGVLREILLRLDGVCDYGLAAERATSSAFDNSLEQFVVSPEFIHAWDSSEHSVQSQAEIISKPAVKLLVRNDAYRAEQLYNVVSTVIPADLAHVTYSISEGLLEVSAPGVNKATGLADVALLLGVSAAEVLAFGDMPNDIEMLQWAGHGVAMGNAADSVKLVADEITTDNDDFGVARVLERYYD